MPRLPQARAGNAVVRAPVAPNVSAPVTNAGGLNALANVAGQTSQNLFRQEEGQKDIDAQREIDSNNDTRRRVNEYERQAAEMEREAAAQAKAAAKRQQAEDKLTAGNAAELRRLRVQSTREIAIGGQSAAQ